MNKYKELFLTTTDTVTGMGAPISENNKDAIYELKERERSKPLIIMVGSIEQARKFKEWSPKAEKLANKVWPGNTTLVLSKDIALRIPNVPKLIELFKELGPCYVTSANKSGHPTYDLNRAKEVFKEITQYYDFGEGSGTASNIINVETGEVLR